MRWKLTSVLGRVKSPPFSGYLTAVGFTEVSTRSVAYQLLNELAVKGLFRACTTYRTLRVDPFQKKRCHVKLGIPKFRYPGYPYLRVVTKTRDGTATKIRDDGTGQELVSNGEAWTRQ